MHSSFAGSARSRPRVNLGGHKKELTKDQLLRKAALERKERAEFRERDNAAQVIQKLWQIKKARIKALDVLRCEFDVFWPQFRYSTKSQQSLKDNPNGGSVFRLYRYFFNAKRDIERTMKVLEYILSLDLNEDEAREEDLALLVVPCFTKTYLYCARPDRNTFFIDDSCNNKSQLLIQGIRRAMFWTVGVGTLFGSLDYCRDHYKILARELVRMIGSRSESSDHLQCVYACISLPLRIKDNEEVYSQLCNMILTQPCLRQCTSLIALLKDADLRKMIAGLERVFWMTNTVNGTRRDLTVSTGEEVLLNFLLITHEQIAHHRDDRDRWLNVVCQGLNNTWYDYTTKNWNEVKESLDPMIDLNEEETSMDARRPFPHIVIPGTPAYDTMSLLTRSSLIANLLLPTPVQRLDHFVNLLLLSYPAQREQILLGLNLFVTDPKAPYNLLKISYQRWLGTTAQAGTTTVKVTCAFVFYLELLLRVLLTMIDDEFFHDQKRPFTMEMILDTAQRLKESAFLLCSSDHRASLPNMPYCSAAYCRELVARVLQQFQTRNLRTPFLSQDFWLDSETVPKLTAEDAIEAFHDAEEDSQDDPREQSIEQQRRGLSIVRMLNMFPYMFSFEARIESLQAVVAADVSANGLDEHLDWVSKTHVTCRREFEFEDGFNALWQIGDGIKGPLAVDYKDIHGLEEAGIDGGGLTKEFLSAMCKQAFNPAFGLFVETPTHLLYPNPAPSAQSAVTIRHYQFLGRVVARCIYSKILVDVAFAPFFLLRWINKLPHIDDLRSLDQGLYTGLINLKNYDGDVENDLSLDFTVLEADGQQLRTIDLEPNGASTPVTRLNRLRYIHLMCNYKLNARINRQAQAFVTGMSEVLDMRWLKMFSPKELQALVGGEPVSIDIDDLQKHTIHSGFGENRVTIKLFWKVVRDFSDDEKRKLLKFVTSTPRPPLLGFAHLSPPFCIRCAENDIDRLPTASTCVNLLKLPPYVNQQQMQDKLRLSINAEAGFDLS